MAKAPPKSNKPNILVIWGDDIGISNLSCYSHGLMGYQDAQHRPHRQGRHDVHRFLWRAMLHGRPLILHYRPERLSHRPVQSRDPGRAGRLAGEDSSTIAAAAQEPGLCDRPVRQKPSRRPQRVCCPPFTASTSSSATSITSMPKKSRRCPTIRTRRISRTSGRVWAARSDPLLGDRQRRSDRRAALGRVGKQKIEDTGPLTSEADGDLRR